MGLAWVASRIFQKWWSVMLRAGHKRHSDFCLVLCLCYHSEWGKQETMSWVHPAALWRGPHSHGEAHTATNRDLLPTAMWGSHVGSRSSSTSHLQMQLALTFWYHFRRNLKSETSDKLNSWPSNCVKCECPLASLHHLHFCPVTLTLD